MSKLAILGGTPVRETAIPWVSTMDKEEERAVHEVMQSGILSEFLADDDDKFLGGPVVRNLEDAFFKRFKVN